MKKQGLLNLIKQIKDDTELKEIESGTMLKLMILLITYINDPDIEAAINEVPM